MLLPGSRLSSEEREEIALGIASGKSLSEIAQGLLTTVEF